MKIRYMEFDYMLRRDGICWHIGLYNLWGSESFICEYKRVQFVPFMVLLKTSSLIRTKGLED